MYESSKGHTLNDGLRKVIASTDTTLSYIPNISKAFLKKYCELNGQINSVFIEFEKYLLGFTPIDEDFVDSVYSIDPKRNSNNCVIISKVKDSWNRDELNSILLDVLDLGMQIRQDQLNGYTARSGKEILESWKEKNL